MTRSVSCRCDNNYDHHLFWDTNLTRIMMAFVSSSFVFNCSGLLSRNANHSDHHKKIQFPYWCREEAHNLKTRRPTYTYLSPIERHCYFTSPLDFEEENRSKDDGQIKSQSRQEQGGRKRRVFRLLLIEQGRDDLSCPRHARRTRQVTYSNISSHDGTSSLSPAHDVSGGSRLHYLSLLWRPERSLYDTSRDVSYWQVYSWERP